ncbi:hypothetical protein [Arthrobacter sp. B6]|uniref:hypothetical protein n=1 Tax=Arthrobacter sp. B6 TaxID=1570137 RepID=UPI0008313435|nr:hypothetical protein [Arthrobacter sp. B6]
MKGWLKGIFAAVSVIAILAAGIAAFLAVDYNKSAAAVPRVRAAADQFVVTDGWTLTTENVKGPGAFCIAVRCPGIQRIWERYDAPKADDVIRMITESGYLLKFSECLDFSVDEKSPVENGISNFGCRTAPVNDLRTQVSVYISRDWNAPPGSGKPEYVYQLILLVSRISSSD